MKRALGVGGVFLRSEHPKKLMAWYAKHLGVPVRGRGASFSWNDKKHRRTGYLVWCFLSQKSKYFAPSSKEAIVNFRVHNLASLLAELREGGVHVVGKIARCPQGKFGWILDPEGNKVELWEPGGTYRWHEAVPME